MVVAAKFPVAKTIAQITEFVLMLMNVCAIQAGPVAHAATVAAQNIPLAKHAR